MVVYGPYSPDRPPWRTSNAKQKELASKKEKKEAALSEAKAVQEKETSAVDAVGACNDLDAIDLYNELGEEMQREVSVCDCFSDDIMASLAVAGAGAVEVSLCERAARACMQRRAR